ncbi:MAG: Bug family tripartite tricarboxylate transporter substrate binding protein [Burkholderiales bacterium]
MHNQRIIVIAAIAFYRRSLSLLATLQVLALALCSIFMVSPTPLHAQTWPQKPIRILIGFAAAGPPDIGTRIIAPKLGELLGQPLVIENRPGAGGVIAMEATAKAAPDGYTMGLGTVGTLFLAKALLPTAPYDPQNFVPVGIFAKTQFIVITHPNVPANTLKEFVDLAKKQPGKFNYGASTPGSPPHMLAEMFKDQAGVDIFGITYKGSADAVQRFLAGDVQMIVDGYTVLGPLITSGKARALMVSSPQRMKKLPDVPTALEVGMPNYVIETFFSFVAPPGTPAAIPRRMNADIVKVMQEKPMIEAMDKLGLDAYASTPEELGGIIKNDWPKWNNAVKAAGIKAQ